LECIIKIYNTLEHLLVISHRNRSTKYLGFVARRLQAVTDVKRRNNLKGRHFITSRDSNSIYMTELREVVQNANNDGLPSPRYLPNVGTQAGRYTNP
jgi:hypothetical protein